MNKFTAIVGIDVAKATLAVNLFYEEKEENFDVDNNLKGLSQLVNKLHKLGLDPAKVLICCENTGHYSEKLAVVANGEGFFVWVVNPIIIARYCVNLSRTKTDPADAKKIKDFAFAHQHLAEKYQVPNPQTRKLTDLFKCRKHYVNSRQRETNYLCSLNDAADPLAFCVETAKANIAFLNAKIKDVEKAIMEIISRNTEFKRQYILLMTIPGIGPVIAERFLFITECFGKFKNWRSLACYIGSAPFPHESGTSVKRKPRTSKKRHRSFKSDLVEGITSTSTRNGQFYTEYYRFMESLKYPHLKIVNNIINMVLKVAFALIKNNTPFDPEFFISQKKSWVKNLEMS
jgi:transposase